MFLCVYSDMFTYMEVPEKLQKILKVENWAWEVWKSIAFPLEMELQVYLNGLTKSDIKSSGVGLLLAVSYQSQSVVCISCFSSCFHETLDKNNFRKKICHGA